MNRRAAVKNLMVMLVPSTTRVFTRRAQYLYVAGARFYPPNERLRAGDAVAFVPTMVRGAHAYAVEDVDGAQIGWVPRSLISKIDATGARRARVVEVSLRRVPWRWYRLVVS